MQIELPKWGPDRFDVDADMDLLHSLTDDMENSLSSLGRPASSWMLSKEQARGSMSDLMKDWCGSVGELSLSDVSKITSVSGSHSMISGYETYLRSIDHQQLLQGLSLGELGDANWRVMDLGSLMDYLLLSAFLDISQDNLKILEVGGGFGRLAEFLTLTGGPHMQYVNIDAVPASLMYCHQYLKHRFPDRKVMLFSPDRDIDSDCDFLVVPAWHLDQLQLSNFDLGINIESMQEMNQELVDSYLGYFERKVRTDGLIYLVNSRDYKFQGSWNIPNNWQCLFRHRTPRSWTPNHPAEIFRRTTRDQSRQNLLRTATFCQELARLKKYTQIIKLEPTNQQTSCTNDSAIVGLITTHGAVTQPISFKPFPSDVELTRSRVGHLLYSIQDEYAGPSLREYGEFRQKELELFKQVITPGDVVIDAGAHIGSHTVAFAQLVEPGGVVVAFEPQSRLYKILNANLVINSIPNVLTYAMALGNSEGEFWTSHPDPSQPYPQSKIRTDATEDVDPVPFVKLDDFQLERLNFLRLHVEGFISKVLEGSKNTIERCRPIMYIENEQTENVSELIRQVMDMGYRLWWHISPFFVSENFKESPENIFPGMVSLNILALPSDMKPIDGLQPILAPGPPKM
ncbi:MAG: putative sugar O-methyltransferase [Holophagaceae bacterium]|nr:putative sugar O-methyltransferase [Holophagaceae bacterium]